MTEKHSYIVSLLKSELTSAMGCTEPIAIAYAAAKARSVLGSFPERAEIAVSPNIIKNAKSVVVPHTGKMSGIESALIAGVVAGRAEEKLEVLSSVTDREIEEMRRVKETLPVALNLFEGGSCFEIVIKLYSGDESSEVHITGRHTNLTEIKKNGEVIFSGGDLIEENAKREPLTVREIVDFADSVDISEVKETLDRQIKYNMAIAEEGLKNDYGANIGKVYLSSYTNDIAIKAKAYAAAASDARMNGCEMPVIINSGSGNQGITASVPVVVYAREMGTSDELLYRALLVSNLVTVHVKRGIGTLSAYCGAVAAGAGAGCGVAYLHGGKYREIAHTLVNALAIDSGLICDGAKASCAAKIATAVENGLLGFNLFKAGNQFFAGEGIVKKGVENTIESISRLANEGMKETDKEIINIMLSNT